VVKVTTEEKSHPGADESQNLRLDYQQTMQYLQMLTNIRFLPLTLLPGIAGFAVSSLINTKGSPESVLAVGIVGIGGASAGIILYDMHNTALYNAAVHRAKRIEKSLGLPPSTKDKPGGLFNERPDRLEAAQGSSGMRFSPLTMQQDLVVAAVYGVVIGAWMHIIVHASFGLFLGKSQIALSTTPVVSILTLVGVTVVFIGGFLEYSSAVEESRQMISMEAATLASIEPSIRKERSSPWFDKTLLILRCESAYWPCLFPAC
jgi:hypothetical protein